MSANTRTPGKIAKAAADADMTVIAFLKQEIERAGSVEDAAQAIGIKSAWALRRMVQAHGYVIKTKQVAEVIPVTSETQPS